MLFYGILNLAQKSISQYADGDGALACWKNSISDYHDAKKVRLVSNLPLATLIFQPKYRICSHSKIAACSGVFGPKVQVDATHNCFVNNQGMEDTNVEGDLHVEHINNCFKAGLMHLCGNYTDDSLQRIAKSLDVKKCLIEKLTPHYTERCAVFLIPNEFHSNANYFTGLNILKL